MNLLRILDGTPEPPVIDPQLDKINESGDYQLPAPMYEFQKELTDQIVSLHYPDILKYCETNDNRDLIIKSLEICINNCMLVSTHPYLLIGHYMPKNLVLKDISNKLAETSGKFNVLKDLINVIILNTSTSTRNIGIVLNNDLRVFDLVEALLLGCNGKKSIYRYVGNGVKKETAKSNSDKNSSLTKIHLIPFDGNMMKDEDFLFSTKFDILIVFDSCVDVSNDFFQRLSTQNRRGRAIILRIIPMKTIEHCKLHYAGERDNHDYLYKLISSIVCLRDRIGNLPPDLIPIYNQNLNYLSGKFFDNVFKNSRSNRFPVWPLPDLPTIPKFSPTDVEKSLLTEVHFHFSYYESNDSSNTNNEKSKRNQKIPSYYEINRLELNYLTNPLKNDYDKLIGIFTNGSLEKGKPMGPNVLTHKLILQLNESFLNLEHTESEYQGYVDYNDVVTQEKIGRRESESSKKLSTILDDIYHAETRISAALKKFSKKMEEVEEMKREISKIDDKIKSFLEDHQIVNETQIEFIDVEKKIWSLQDDISALLKKIKSKQDEKNYMNIESQNALASIKESEEQLEIANQELNENKRKFDDAFIDESEEFKQFNLQKDNLIKKIEAEREKNITLKLKLEKSFKFLKDTSHLKKRKGRGITPIK